MKLNARGRKEVWRVKKVRPSEVDPLCTAVYHRVLMTDGKVLTRMSLIAPSDHPDGRRTASGTWKQVKTSDPAGFLAHLLANGYERVAVHS